MKIDCVLCQLQDTVAAALSTKSELSLRIHALGPCRIWCCYLQGKVVGQVDVSTGDTIAQAVREAGHALADDSDVPVNIAVRTIKRDPSSQVVTSVQVRCRHNCRRHASATRWRTPVCIFPVHSCDLQHLPRLKLQLGCGFQHKAQLRCFPPRCPQQDVVAMATLSPWLMGSTACCISGMLAAAHTGTSEGNPQSCTKWPVASAGEGDRPAAARVDDARAQRITSGAYPGRARA